MSEHPDAFPGLTIHALVEREVRLTPTGTAVSFEGTELSYGELNRRANKLARRLGRVGIGVESIVALYLPRSIELIVVILAVLKAGGAYLPIDPDYPGERVRYMLEDSGASLVVATDELLDGLGGHQGTLTLSLEREKAAIATEASHDLELGVGPNNAAYVIYTSGSTGRPKGVVVAHGGAVNLAAASGQLFELRPSDRVLQFAALGFDASVWEILMALTWGATLVVPSETRRRWRLPQVLQESEATIVTLPPSTLMTLGELQLPALSRLVIGGEVLPPSLADQWASGRAVFNAYGPTETTVCSSAHRYVPDGSAAVRVPIGRPLPNISMYALDPRLNEVTDGEPGELYIGGAGVARGYLRRPALTAQRFLPDPFSDRSGARMYRTGDLVVRRPDGTFEFLGRVDDQIKIRGYRVEPGEIEEAILRHGSIQSVAVVAEAAAAGDEPRLVAYVTSGESGDPSFSALREELGRELPEFMIPQAIVALDELPVTPNKKVDRDALARRGTADAGKEPRRLPEEAPGEFAVAVNAERQYSIWPRDRELPPGWTSTGAAGAKATCLAAIESSRHDLRPASVAVPEAPL